MLVVETMARIRRAHLVRGVPIKNIARDLRVSKNAVHKVVRGDETAHGYARKIQPMPKLEREWKSSSASWRTTRASGTGNVSERATWLSDRRVREVSRHEVVGAAVGMAGGDDFKGGFEPGVWLATLTAQQRTTFGIQLPYIC